MASIDNIKNWFRKGFKPTQQQFWDSWDSFWHKDEQLPISAIKDWDTTLVDNDAFDTHLKDTNAHADLFALKADKADIYTKTDANIDLALKENITDNDAKLALKADKTDIYTKADADIALALKANETMVVSAPFYGFKNKIINGNFEVNQRGFTTQASSTTEIRRDVASPIFATTGQSPDSIYIDANGNIYTANSSSNNITKITPAGVSSVFATTGSNPKLIGMDGNGNLYTANYGSKDVSKITPAGVSNRIGGMGSYSTTGTAVSSNGTVYFSKLSLDSVTTLEELNFGTTGHYPVTLAIDRYDDLYTYNLADHNVTKISGSTPSIFSSVGSFNKMIFDRNNNMYGLDIGGKRIVKIIPTGESQELATLTNTPADFCIDTNGNLYVINSDSNDVTIISPTGISSLFGTTATRPTAIAVDSSGNVYTSHSSSNNVTKITPGGVSVVVTTNDVTTPANQYTFDQWFTPNNSTLKIISTGTDAGNKIKINSGSIAQKIEDKNLFVGNYTLSWYGNVTPSSTQFTVNNITPYLDDNTRRTAILNLSVWTAGVHPQITFTPEVTGATLSKVQLEEGLTTTAFERRPYAMELQLCQRYYQLTELHNIFSYSQNAEGRAVHFSYPVSMYAAGTVTKTTGTFLLGGGFYIDFQFKEGFELGTNSAGAVREINFTVTSVASLP